jgi:hypothetical protein
MMTIWMIASIAFLVGSTMMAVRDLKESDDRDDWKHEQF